MKLYITLALKFENGESFRVASFTVSLGVE